MKCQHCGDKESASKCLIPNSTKKHVLCIRCFDLVWQICNCCYPEEKNCKEATP